MSESRHRCTPYRSRSNEFKAIRRTSVSPRDPRNTGTYVELRGFEPLTPSMRRVISRQYLSPHVSLYRSVSLTQRGFSRFVSRRVISWWPGSRSPFGVK